MLTFELSFELSYISCHSIYKANGKRADHACGNVQALLLAPSLSRAHPALSHCSHLLLKLIVATNISHWLNVKKSHICEKVYFNQLLDFKNCYFFTLY